MLNETMYLPSPAFICTQSFVKSLEMLLGLNVRLATSLATISGQVAIRFLGFC